MENFDIDNRFKEGLDTINPMLDNDEIWDNIEPHLKKKKKRRRFIIWFFFGAVGLLGLLLFKYGGSSSSPSFTGLENQKDAPTTQIDSNEKDIAKTIVSSPPSSTSNEEGKKQTVILAEASDIEQDSGTSKKLPVDRSTSKVIAKPTEAVKPNRNEEQKSISPTAKPSADKSKSIELGLAEVAIIPPKKEVKNTEQNPNPKSFVEEQIAIDEPAIKTKDKSSVKTTVSEISSTPGLQSEKETSQNETTSQLEEVKNEPELKKRLTKKERKKANKKRQEERKKAKEDKEKKKKEKKAEKPKLIKPSKLPKWKFHLQFMGSGIYTLHNLKDQNRNESTYLDYRSQYVSGTEGFGTSLNFVAESPSGFMLVSGIEYQQLHESIKRVEEISESEFEDVVVTVTEDAEGNIINQTNSMQLVTTTTIYNQKFYNQYRFVNIPLGIGYTFKKNKMRFKLLGGVDINTYFRFSGRVINKSEEHVKLHSGSVNSYRKFFNNTVGLGIWTNLEWHQPLGKKTSLVVSPGIQAPLGSISPNDDKWAISHKLLKLKLEVGLNYRIGDMKNPKSRGKKRKRS